MFLGTHTEKKLLLEMFRFHTYKTKWSMSSEEHLHTVFGSTLDLSCSHTTFFFWMYINMTCWDVGRWSHFYPRVIFACNGKLKFWVCWINKTYCKIVASLKWWVIFVDIYGCGPYNHWLRLWFNFNSIYHWITGRAPSTPTVDTVQMCYWCCAKRLKAWQGGSEN